MERSRQVFGLFATSRQYHESIYILKDVIITQCLHAIRKESTCAECVSFESCNAKQIQTIGSHKPKVLSITAFFFKKQYKYVWKTYFLETMILFEDLFNIS